MRALVVAVALASLAVSAGAAAPAFTPKAIAGSWAGTWSDVYGGGSGSARIVARSLSGNRKLALALELGDALGCGAPARASTGAVPKGSGANRWNGAGFRARLRSNGLAAANVLYVHRTRRLTTRAGTLACAPGLRWYVEGVFSTTSFVGVLHVYAADGAHSERLLALDR